MGGRVGGRGKGGFSGSARGGEEEVGEQPLLAEASSTRHLSKSSLISVTQLA